MTLTPSPTSLELLLTGADERGIALARALGGRPSGQGYILTPGRAAKFSTLYGAGFTAARVYYGGHVKPWRYLVEGQRLTLSAALRVAGASAPVQTAAQTQPLEV